MRSLNFQEADVLTAGKKAAATVRDSSSLKGGDEF
jgi:hypothetical protein